MSALQYVAVQPRVKHTATVVFLHGLGDSGDGWSFLAKQASAVLPHVKWIFPHAPTRPIAINGNHEMPGWYNIYSLSADKMSRADEAGLSDSMRKVYSLIDSEIRSTSLTSNQIVLGGFSQGAALTLYTLLRASSKYAGFIGLSGYLPAHESEKEPPARLAATCANRDTPVFMGHGDSDNVVKHSWGDLSANLLKELKFSNVSFKTYPGVAHSIDENGIADVIKFISSVTKTANLAKADL